MLEAPSITPAAAVDINSDFKFIYYSPFSDDRSPREQAISLRF